MGRKNNVFVGEQERRPEDRKLSRDGALTLVLVHPRIPQNTGSRLDLIRPLFPIDDSKMRRAGLDYWHLLDVRVFDSLEEWFEKNPAVKPWLVEVGGSTVYTEAAFARGDFVMFGDEQDGIPPSLLEKFPDRHLRIPQQGVRSMNLSNCVSLVAYEALRQLDWLGLEP